MKTDKQIWDAASEWVFETNEHKWSNNDDSAGDNMGSFIAGAKWALTESKMNDKITIEQAAELVKSMYAVHSQSASEITRFFAKQCALIAVHELIKDNCKGSEFKDPSYQDIRIEYWLEVKKQIEQL